MKTPLPFFILIGLVLISVIGIMLFETGAGAAVVEVNNTAKEDFALMVYGIDAWMMFGLGAIIVIVALYIALRMFM